MRIGGRLQGAIEVLSEVEERKRPIANALKDWGTAHRFAGSGDRPQAPEVIRAQHPVVPGPRHRRRWSSDP